MFGCESGEVAVKRLAEQLGLVDAELVCPTLRRCCLMIVDSETDHRHTPRVDCITPAGKGVSTTSRTRRYRFLRLDLRPAPDQRFVRCARRREPTSSCGLLVRGDVLRLEAVELVGDGVHLGDEGVEVVAPLDHGGRETGGVEAGSEDFADMGFLGECPGDEAVGKVGAAEAVQCDGCGGCTVPLQYVESFVLVAVPRVAEVGAGDVDDPGAEAAGDEQVPRRCEVQPGGETALGGVGHLCVPVGGSLPVAALASNGAVEFRGIREAWRLSRPITNGVNVASCRSATSK